MKYASCIMMNSDIYLAKKMIQKSMNHLQEWVPGCSADDLFDIRLILNELIINAIVHGNRQDAEKKISMRLLILKETNDIVLTIGDEGKGLPYDNVTDIDSFHEQLSKEDKGKGLLLVSALVDTIEILPNEAGIQVTKRIEISEEVED